MKVCISVDLDNYQEYESLVVGAPPLRSPPSLYDQALPRFLDLFARCGVRATFFVIGRDLEDTRHREWVREIARHGHEVANHSYSHPYDFRALPREEREREIDRCGDALEELLGERPVGWRTPSCEIDGLTLDLLARRDYLYDSSVFPTPIMWLFMVYGRFFVRRADYQLGEARAALAPAQPYVPSPGRLHRPRREPASGPFVVEVPFSVVPGLRVPFYSTLMRRFGSKGFDWMLRAYGRRRPVLHLLFHLVELADLGGTPLGEALERTPGLGVPFARRAAFVQHAVSAASAAGDSVPLRDVAAAERARIVSRAAA